MCEQSRLWRTFFVLAVSLTLATACGTSVTDGTDEDAGEPDNPTVLTDAGADAGTGRPFGSYCISSERGGACYGQSARVIGARTLDGGSRELTAVATANGTSTTVRFVVPAGQTPIPAQGRITYLEAMCPNFACQLRCQYGSGDGGIAGTGTLYRNDATVIEASFETPLASADFDDGGCPPARFVVDLYVAQVP